MKVSVLIVNYKSKGLTRNLINNILDLDWPFDYEIIIVDNASNDGSVHYLQEQFPNVSNLHYVKLKENKGYGAGNNAGAKIAKGEYLLVLNPDIVVKKNTVSELLKWLDSHQDIGVISPKLSYANGKVQQSYFRYYKWKTPLYRRTFLGKRKSGQKDLNRFLMTDVKIQGATAVDWLMGSFWLVPKRVFEELNGFDEKYFMYFEDTDFCKRVNKAGYKVIYYPLVGAIHLHARQSKSNGFFKSLLNKLTWVHISSAIKYFRKFGLK